MLGLNPIDIAMALSSRATRCATSLLRTSVPIARARSFASQVPAAYLYVKNQVPVRKHSAPVRLFSSSAIRSNQTQTAPNASAYLESGVIKGAANPVNVKKVLVIGSGGLSIGQAGEFDYSGQFLHLNLSAKCESPDKKMPFKNQSLFSFVM